MHRLPGGIRQIGYVVEDIERAMWHWVKVMGIGPWFFAERVPIRNYTYRGQAYEIHNAVALANSGALQVELIQPRSDTPSMYREFLKAGGGGLHHVAFWTERFDEDLAAMLAAGFRIEMGGEVGEHGRFVYFDRAAHLGTVIELSEVVGPKGRLFRLIREAAEHWDGTEPVRPFPSLEAL